MLHSSSQGVGTIQASFHSPRWYQSSLRDHEFIRSQCLRQRSKKTPGSVVYKKSYSRDLSSALTLVPRRGNPKNRVSGGSHRKESGRGPAGAGTRPLPVWAAAGPGPPSLSPRNYSSRRAPRRSHGHGQPGPRPAQRCPRPGTGSAARAGAGESLPRPWGRGRRRGGQPARGREGRRV